MWFDGHTDATITHCLFEGNAATDSPDMTYGGAVFHRQGGTLHLLNSTFRSCSATMGGAIFVQRGATLIANQIVVHGCVADANGGAISCTLGASCSIFSSHFSHNRAQTSGGAISAIRPSLIVLANTSMESNMALEDCGGAVHLVAAQNTTIHDVSFHNNVVERGYGGGLCAYDSSIEFRNSSLFWRNQATVGGALAIISGSLTAGMGDHAGIQFLDNRAVPDVLRTKTILVSGVPAKAGAGGALFARGARVSMQHALFKNNTAHTVGGAANVESFGILELRDCAFVENKALNGDGGGLFASSWFPSIVRLAGCIYRANTAFNGSGGGVSLQSLAVQVNGRVQGMQVQTKGALCTANMAGMDGGALHGVGLGGLLVYDSVFTSNSAGGNGGGFSCRDCSQATVQHCNGTGNMAASQRAVLVVGPPSLQAPEQYRESDCMETQPAPSRTALAATMCAVPAARLPAAKEAGQVEACACNHRGSGSWTI